MSPLMLLLLVRVLQVSPQPIYSKKKAKLYGESNQAGVEFVAATVEKESIDCDFQRNDTYSFAENKDNLDKIQKEYDAAKLH